ncbi:MAG: F0F1 ATP synthase subunit gamma, partial [Candidatus Omnitrophica bacterium]|nr:F0F1 ATP synthase subunit gamma [Candidatus Omnitrophota bacterium]
FFNAAKKKARFEQFALAFTEFFRMVSLSHATSPLVSPKSEATSILGITWEGGFMADLTAKVLRASLAESEKHDTKEFIILGRKGADKMTTQTNKEVIAFCDLEEVGIFNTAVAVKDYIIDQVLKENIGRVYVVYPRAKSLNLIKPFVSMLLPSEELLARQSGIKDTIEKVIVESGLNDIIHYLADIWLTCRIYEMIEDCVISSYAAQSQQLEASLERMKKDKKGLVMGFRKAKKSDVDKSLREVFTSKMMTGGRR